MKTTKPSKQERLLQSYFDGELSDKKDRAVKEMLDQDVSDGTASLAGEKLQQMRDVRRALREMVDQQLRDEQGKYRDISLWKGIEKEIERGINSPEQKESWFSRSFSQSIFPWISKFISLSSSPVGMAGAFASVAGIAFIIGLGVGSGGEKGVSPAFQPTAVRQIARTNFPLSAPVVNVSQRKGSHVSTRPRVSRFHINVSAPARLQGSYQHKAPLRIDTGQLIGSEPVPGGLRTDGLDIDWIRSDRDFSIVPSADRKSLPIIWVSQKRSFR